MSSPIHKFLFSPPPSPPHPSETKRAPRPPPLTSLKSLLPDNLRARPSLDGSSGELKPRSPRTPQQKHFTLDNGYPASYPSRNIEATPRVITPNTPRRKIENTIASPPYLPTNVPSAPLPIPSTLPRPLLRLLFLASLIASSVMLLVFVPSARLPSLHTASVGRRLALAPDGRAYLDVATAVTSWEEAKERDYQPPQIRATRMMKRSAHFAEVEERSATAVRPSSNSRPLPASHELLAIQSYLLQSAYNVLPDSIDPDQPLDANVVLGFSGQNLGAMGSAAEKAWLEEIEREREDEVVIWYGGDGSTQHPHDLLSQLEALHGPSRHPTLVPCHARPDRPLLTTIFDRLSLPLSNHPLVMIGNQPIVGDAEGLEELRGSGRLASMLGKIGWRKEEAEAERGSEREEGWKPKLAVVKKKEMGELDMALRKQ